MSSKLSSPLGIINFLLLKMTLHVLTQCVLFYRLFMNVLDFIQSVTFGLLDTVALELTPA